MALNGVIRSPRALPRFHDIYVETIHGEKFKLDKYAGKVVVVINVASFGNDASKVLQQMNDLQIKYSGDVAVLGFPCNQFSHAENGNGEEILLTMKHVRPGNDFHPKFDVLSKVEVNGQNAHPLFQMLREALPLPSDDLHTFVNSPLSISWSPVCRNDIANNFEKFIIAPNGKPYRRYSSNILVVNLQSDIKQLIEKFKTYGESRKVTDSAQV